MSQQGKKYTAVFFLFAIGRSIPASLEKIFLNIVKNCSVTKQKIATIKVYCRKWIFMTQTYYDPPA
jgi:hypothetical protein